MKKILFILSIVSITISCVTEEKKLHAKEQLHHVEGGFLYTADAAVIQAKNEMFAVKINDMMHKLNEQCKVYKKGIYDMVPVKVKGEVIKNPGEGWERMLIIKEIVKVEPRTVKEEIIELK